MARKMSMREENGKRLRASRRTGRAAQCVYSWKPQVNACKTIDGQTDEQNGQSKREKSGWREGSVSVYMHETSISASTFVVVPTCDELTAAWIARPWID